MAKTSISKHSFGVLFGVPGLMLTYVISSCSQKRSRTFQKRRRPF